MFQTSKQKIHVSKTASPEMTGKALGQVRAHCCGEKKDKKGLKENRIEEDYSIVTNERKGSGEGGEHEVAGVHGPPTYSGLGNICSEVARD